MQLIARLNYVEVTSSNLKRASGKMPRFQCEGKDSNLLQLSYYQRVFANYWLLPVVPGSPDADLRRAAAHTIPVTRLHAFIVVTIPFKTSWIPNQASLAALSNPTTTYATASSIW